MLPRLSLRAAVLRYESYLRYLDEGGLPDWELPNILAKYFVTTGALESATTL